MRCAAQARGRHKEFSSRKEKNMSVKNLFQLNQLLMLLEMKDKFKKHMDDMLDVRCLMLVTMTPELQKQHEDMVAYEMIQNLKEIYE
ncbi:hypothetical protein V6N11_012350 [Hibiscus sabdariffa]|uniref:Uncharacterized protein n=1 Tax=Hibiscus sabdariffa TaxID=183260 RepID=A0ABR2QAW0_9ROSI